jgi:hypothetical protein
MLYAEFSARLAAILEIDPATDSDFALYLPQVILNAEQRCYRDLDPLAARRAQYTNLVPGVPFFTGPPDWLMGRRLVGTDPDTGYSFAIERRDESFLDEYEIDYLAIGRPKYWAEQRFQVVWVSPAPEKVYEVRMHYTFRPDVLSEANTETWLSKYFPDLFFKAAMIEMSRYKLNLAAAAEQTADYGQLLQAALREEGRRKGGEYFEHSTSPSPSSTKLTGSGAG